LAVGRNQPLQPQRVDLGSLLSDEVEMLRRTLGETIQIEASRQPDLWFTTADPSQVGDALLNLALNARDAMPRGGKLTIEAANCRVDAQDAVTCGEMGEGDYVVLTVTDTGIGMPQSVLDRAIEPFFTTKPPSVGSGLGLSMVYGFAKQSGGHLDIQSIVEVGTHVRLYLPRASQQSAAPLGTPKNPAVHPTGTETVLLVDDNQTLMEVTRRQLTSRGYRVIGVTSGLSALTVLESDQPVDLLFTDVVMPGGMSGPELVASAQRLRPDLRVLFTTGYAAELSEQQNHYTLPKPYHRRELSRAIRATLDGLKAAA
jgi:CheY-like chemotaxis protein